MGKLYKRTGAILIGLALLLTGCGRSGLPSGMDGTARITADSTLAETVSDTEETAEELYEKALDENVLIVYTVTTRAAETKELFENEYPGLSVEIRDLRSPDLIRAVKENYEKGLSDCDIVICNDNSGEFQTQLVDTGIVVPFVPSDIAPHMKKGMIGDTLSFLQEAELLLYNSAKWEEAPVENIWELTEGKWNGRIYMPNPLRSFSTYAFCGASFDHEKELAEAYREYTGEKFPSDGGCTEEFWKRISENIVFTNSSDEVVEALNSGNADFGIAVSSKLRLRDIGYEIEPVYHLKPFSGCRTTSAVMLGSNSENTNTAKLFIRYLLGETDGKGKGYRPFQTPGTWSARSDVPDGNPVPQEEMDLITPDQRALAQRKDFMEEFWTEILRGR